ncbi:MAG: DUF4126 domain-containing protein [Xenococcaceae cyanobacterium MO_188.B29]|nr:DUF4126 domain-containing protein [Xenococcaceae cyanobacterium MO_188.B29]
MLIEHFLAFCLGLTLSAAVGFRVFVPPLVMSLGAIHGDLPLASGFEWLGTSPAAIALGFATVIEILAYYIPVVDNLLDTIEIPTAIAVGTILTAASLGDINPIVQWTLAVIAGGGTAGIIDSFTSITRLASTGVTGGMGNPLISTTEALSAAVLSLLALLVPFLAISLVMGLLLLGIKKIAKVKMRL